jgi:uncharacterized protein (TIGR03435 family)
MKRIAWFAIALVPFIAASLSAQNIAGTWQGTLHTPQRDLRTVWKLSKAEAGGWKTTFYSIDQSGQGYSASSTAFHGSTLRCMFIILGGSTYEGKLSADGKSIAGTWTQGPNPIALVLERATPESEWAIPEPPPPVRLMAADAVPLYEVSTFKPSKPGTPQRYYGWPTTVTSNTNLIFLIAWAYGLQARQIVGAPEWASKDAYDMEAKCNEEGIPNDQQRKQALRRLIEDRFKLKYHYDKKEMPAYELAIAKDGSKLTESAEPTDNHHYSLRNGDFTGYNFSVQDLGNILGRFVLDKPVMNRTGLAGRYDMELHWTPNDFELGYQAGNAAAAEKADAPPGLFDAIQQQMGLKLQSGKIADVMAIDRVEKPSEN